jgi:hypothetical protein
VQREFVKERRALAKYIRNDAILGKFFDVFLFEEVPAQERSATAVYLSEVADSDIYLGIFGESYGNMNSKGGGLQPNRNIIVQQKNKKNGFASSSVELRRKQNKRSSLAASILMLYVMDFQISMSCEL